MQFLITVKLLYPFFKNIQHPENLLFFTVSFFRSSGGIKEDINSSLSLNNPFTFKKSFMVNCINSFVSPLRRKCYHLVCHSFSVSFIMSVFMSVFFCVHVTGVVSSASQSGEFLDRLTVRIAITTPFK